MPRTPDPGIATYDRIGEFVVNYLLTPRRRPFTTDRMELPRIPGLLPRQVQRYIEEWLYCFAQPEPGCARGPMAAVQQYPQLITLTRKLWRDLDSPPWPVPASPRPRGRHQRAPLDVMGDGNGPEISMRVELHPATDLWMQGARYGTITQRFRDGILGVHVDALRRTVRVAPRNLQGAID
jgi:hypothetical protein